MFSFVFLFVFLLLLLFLYFRIYIMTKNISLDNIQKEKDVLVDAVATQRNLFLRVNMQSH